MTMAPAARRLATARASLGATTSAVSNEPLVWGSPATPIASLTVTGTPCSGGTGPPAATARSAAAASDRASSNRVATTAFSSGLSSSIRSMNASSTATGDSSPARMPAARSAALSSVTLTGMPPSAASAARCPSFASASRPLMISRPLAPSMDA